MELRINGLDVQVDPAEQEDAQLIDFAQEMAEVARKRGLELPFEAGSIAVENAAQTIDGHVEVPIIDSKESLAKQLPAAIKGLKAVDTVLYDEDFYPETFNEDIEAEFKAWFTDDKLAYVIAAQEADPALRFTLVATRNITVTDLGLVEIAKSFGKNQSRRTFVTGRQLYEKYTPEQISGTNPDNCNIAVFSLIPNKPHPKTRGSVEELRVTLSELQVDYPYLKVPSPLESVTYWHVLRARGDRFVGVSSQSFARADIIHFDLPEQEVHSGIFRVPWTSILEGDGIGVPQLEQVTTKFEHKDAAPNCPARIALG